ncbi:MAG: carboxylating nicotinate-nucleotide diphosphorylase [Candidatus Omnitrophota bacterium]|nr:MAG: carboxylating nicotinate-nucleotide diphosphorylase [Candidatus Omnitrophota bacterium]
MNRKKVLLAAFQRGHLLSLKNPMYRCWIEKFIVDETRGDIGTGDITSNAVLDKNPVAKAVIKTRENGVVAGAEEAAFLYKSYGLRVKQLKKDGQLMRKGDKLLELEGGEKELLKLERSGLDVLQRMSGIATLTYNLIKKISGRVMIAPTRKTHWRYMDKKAVYDGHGLTHRLALWESILIKDNHLTALRKEGVKDVVGVALERAWKQRKKGIFVEIEVADRKDAIRAAEKFKELQEKSNGKPCFIMLDNMLPGGIKKIVAELKKKKLYGYVLLEASGGINPGNIAAYSKTGVDVLSLGYLTHSSRSLNIKQEIIRK